MVRVIQQRTARLRTESSSCRYLLIVVVARHGTAGRIENCQIGVFLAYATSRGQTLLDRELYLPAEWTTDRPRCEAAGIPQERTFATKPELAVQMLKRTRTAGVSLAWVTGDCIYGDSRTLRGWLEKQGQAYVLAVSGKERVWRAQRQQSVKTLLADLPTEGWERLSAGAGSKGPRWYDWLRLELNAPRQQGWKRWLLVRRSCTDPTEVTAYVAFAPAQKTRAEQVRVAGMRWTVEESIQTAKGEVGIGPLRGSKLDRLVPAYHAGDVGTSVFVGCASRTGCRSGAKKGAADFGGDEQFSVLQSPPRAPVGLSCAEIRRLFWQLVVAVERTAGTVLRWSGWRRWHQAWARYHHYRRRAGREIAQTIAQKEDAAQRGNGCGVCVGLKHCCHHPSGRGGPMHMIVESCWKQSCISCSKGVAGESYQRSFRRGKRCIRSCADGRRQGSGTRYGTDCQNQAHRANYNCSTRVCSISYVSKAYTN